MVAVGMLLSDVPSSVPPAQQFDDVRRIVAAAQQAGMTYIAIGQHFLYGDLRWLQPVPLLARLAAECDRDTRLATQIMIAPLYHPVLLAEEDFDAWLDTSPSRAPIYFGTFGKDDLDAEPAPSATRRTSSLTPLDTSVSEL